MKTLSEQQLHNRLQKYYKKHFGDCDTDGWHNNPAINEWEFERCGDIIHLVCDMQTGKVSEK